jgi:hypothetical protein
MTLSMNMQKIGRGHNNAVTDEFLMVFYKNGKTQICTLSYGAVNIATLVPDGPQFPESLAQNFHKICATIDEAI